MTENRSLLPARPGVKLSEEFILPPLPHGGSIALRNWMAMVLHPHPDITPSAPPEPVYREAVTALTALADQTSPATEATIVAFLWPVADAVEYTPSEADFYRRANVLHLATGDIPHVAWTYKAQRELCRTCRRLPSVQQIIEVIEPGIAGLQQRVRALNAIIKAGW